MSMPKDTKGTAPDDVAAHGLKFRPSDVGSQAGEQDSGEDVAAHGAKFRPSDVGSQAGEQDSGEDVEGHGSRFNG